MGFVDLQKEMKSLNSVHKWLFRLTVANWHNGSCILFHNNLTFSLLVRHSARVSRAHNFLISTAIYIRTWHLNRCKVSPFEHNFAPLSAQKWISLGHKLGYEQAIKSFSTLTFTRFQMEKVSFYDLLISFDLLKSLFLSSSWKHGYANAIIACK